MVVTPAFVNSLGLGLDIIGVVLLLSLGFPRRSAARRNSIILEQTDPIEAARARFYDRMAYIALLYLVIGFALQLVSN
jgi:hypothetical protein